MFFRFLFVLILTFYPFINLIALLDKEETSSTTPAKRSRSTETDRSSQTKRHKTQAIGDESNLSQETPSTNSISVNDSYADLNHEDWAQIEKSEVNYHSSNPSQQTPSTNPISVNDSYADLNHEDWAQIEKLERDHHSSSTSQENPSTNPINVNDSYVDLNHEDWTQIEKLERDHHSSSTSQESPSTNSISVTDPFADLNHEDWTQIEKLEQNYLSTNPSQSSQNLTSQIIASQSSSPISSDISSSEESEELSDSDTALPFQHLTTSKGHNKHLIQAIKSARQSILITSYTFSRDMSQNGLLFQAIRDACYRGVKVYLYANKILLDADSLRSINNLRNLTINQTPVHSKLLVIDDQQITIGSYDWLSGPWDGLNASIVLEEDHVKPVKERLWDVLNKYRQVQLHPQQSRRISLALKKLNPVDISCDDSESGCELLTTSKAHKDSFKDCFKIAKTHLSICAPFITGETDYLESILPKQMLVRFLKKCKLTIFYRANDPKIVLLQDYLDQVLSEQHYRLWRNVTLTPVQNLHRKSLWIDDNLYVEGSYNWLSSARSLGDPYAYMETSLLFTGEWARELIERFER